MRSEACTGASLSHTPAFSRLQSFIHSTCDELFGKIKAPAAAITQGFLLRSTGGKPEGKLRYTTMSVVGKFHPHNKEGVAYSWVHINNLLLAILLTLIPFCCLHL